MVNIKDKEPKKPNVPGTVWSILIALLPALFGFFTKNKLIPVVSAMILFLLIYGSLWLTWLIRIHKYEINIINNQTIELDKNIENSKKLQLENTSLCAEKQKLISEIQNLTTNRDTLKGMYENLKKDNANLKNEYNMIFFAIYTASLNNPEISNYIKKFKDTKEFIDGTKTISHSQDNQ